MCSICMTSPCHPRCPNAEPEPPECEVCGTKIVGKFYDGRKLVCEDCLREMDFEDLLKEFYVELEETG